MTYVLVIGSLLLLLGAGLVTGTGLWFERVLRQASLIAVAERRRRALAAIQDELEPHLLVSPRNCESLALPKIWTD